MKWNDLNWNDNSSEQTPTKKKKREAPAHSKLQTEVIKMICDKYNVKYPEGMKMLKEIMIIIMKKDYH